VTLSKFFSRETGLKTLTDNSYKAINEGLYDADKYDYDSHSIISLKKTILTCSRVPIISEIKFASPSKGKILDQSKITPEELAIQMTKSGAAGISVLTQPYLFEGSINNLASVRKSVSVPLLMKDIIVSEVQIDAAKKIGADCILLIKTVFDKGFAEGSMEKFTDYATRKGLEVISEIHSDNEFKEILKNKKQLTSYAGFDVQEKQSGTSVKGKPRISKKGNKYLRKAMHLPATRARASSWPCS